MYDPIFVAQIGEYFLKQKYPNKNITIDINSRDVAILDYLGLTINEKFQKELELAPEKKKQNVINQNIAILNFNSTTNEIDNIEIKGLPVDASINNYLKTFDGKGNYEYSSFLDKPVKTPKKAPEVYMLTKYIKTYLEEIKGVNKKDSPHIIKNLEQLVYDLNTTYYTFKIDGKWLFEFDELIQYCYEEALKPINQACVCPICNRNHEISFTKTKFFKGKQIITDIWKEKGFKEKSEHYLNFCPECYLKLSAGYTKIYAQGDENEIFTLTKQSRYKLMFVPKTILNNDELDYLISIFRNIYKEKICDFEKINELILKFRRFKSLKGQFVLFKNENNLERVLKVLNIPIQSIFRKMEHIELPNLEKCLKEKILDSFNEYVLLYFLQNFIEEGTDRVDKYIFQIIECIAYGNIDKDLLLRWIKNSYNTELKQGKVENPREFVKKIINNEYIKEMIVMNTKYQYTDEQKNILNKIKETSKDEIINQLLEYIYNRGIHPNAAYLIFLGATMKHIERIQYNNDTVPNMFRNIKNVSSIDHLEMLHQKTVNKILDYSSSEHNIIPASISITLAETFYSFEPMTELQDDATHNLVFGYGQILIDNLSKGKNKNENN